MEMEIMEMMEMMWTMKMMKTMEMMEMMETTPGVLRIQGSEVVSSLAKKQKISK